MMIATFYTIYFKVQVYVDDQAAGKQLKVKGPCINIRSGVWAHFQSKPVFIRLSLE